MRDNLLALSTISTNPAKTTHLYNIFTTSAQRLRRWSNIVQMLYKCFVLTGITLREFQQILIHSNLLSQC